MTRSSTISRRNIPLVTGVMLALTLVALPAAAQRAERLNEQAAPTGPQETKIVPTMRLAVSDRLSEAQICLEEGDVECARETLDRLQNMRDLNNYERAQLFNFLAFLAFDQDDTAGAISAYEQMLALPHEDMTDGLIQSSMRNLANLYLQEERYEEGLGKYQEWMALPTVTPNPSDYYLLATIYYQMERYADGIPALQTAIDMANAEGDIGEESWYQLLYVFHFQLEQADEVLEVLSFMVENWPKRDWIMALAGQLSIRERENDTLSLYEAAYEAGMLNRSTEFVQLANLYLNGRVPFKAADLLQKGLDEGWIESTVANWRLLAQAWQMAQDHERAIPAFEHAAELSPDGNMDRMLAQSYAFLADWESCADAARTALERGGLDREDLVQMQLGQCLMNNKDYQGALTAFQAAARDDRQAQAARRFVVFVQDLITRDRTNAELIASLQAQ